MNPHLAELYRQQGRLQERIAVQRQVLAQRWVPVHSAMRGADAALQWLHGAADYLRSHPLFVAAAVAGVVVLRPRRAWVWGERAFFVWHRWRRWQRWVSLYRLRL